MMFCGTRFKAIALAAVIVLWSAPALAQEGEEAGTAEQVELGADAPIYERGGLFDTGLVIGAKLGGGFSQPFSDLGGTFAGELELGYVLPFLRRTLQVFVSGQYAGPSVEGSDLGPDPRLPGEGNWQYEVTMHQAVVTGGLLYRIPLTTDMVRPYLSAGGRAYLWSSDITGEVEGEPFGDYEEQGTDYGAFGALGADIFVGPGSILIEAQFGWAEVDSFVLRDTNASSINAVLGYRLFL